MKPRFAFVVPLRNPATTNDWSSVVKLSIETLHSLSRRGTTPAEIVLACRDFPDVQTDSNVTVIRHPFPDPKTNADLRRDKYAKIKMALIELRRRKSPFYVMKFDADDLVSERLAPWILENANERGYLIDSGYYMNMKSGRLVSVQTNFHLRCGSSNILFAEPRDLPSSMDDKGSFDLMRLGHHIVAKTFESRGAPLDPVPFPACIYRTGHGDNISTSRPIIRPAQNEQSNRKFNFGRTLRQASARIRHLLEPTVDEKIRAEFCLPR